MPDRATGELEEKVLQEEALGLVKGCRHVVGVVLFSAFTVDRTVFRYQIRYGCAGYFPSMYLSVAELPTPCEPVPCVVLRMAY